MASIPASHFPIQCCAQGEKSINIKQMHGLLSVFSYVLYTIIMRSKIKIQILEIFTLFLQIKSEWQILLQSFT